MWSLGLLLSLACLGYANAFLFSSVDWSALKVTWDTNPLNAQDGFSSMPRTTSDAANAGFTENANGCDVAAGKTFLGRRFLKNGDTAVMLLFDNRGYIAGIQVGIPKNLRSNYPPSTLRPPWIAEGQQWILTAYFVDPSIICQGRTPADFSSQGTGTNLYIQMGRDPIRNSVMQPKLESNIGSTAWVRHQCFRTMGVHYWYNTTVDMTCDHFFPVFLMYNSGKLNAFGWAMNADLSSTRYEHPTSSVLSMFFDPVPRCLLTDSVKSTLHIFLDRTPLLNFC